MSESFALTGRIVGVKPRGKPKDGVQTFWTLEIQENATDKYPRKVSFNSHEKSGEIKLDWPIVNQAMTSGQPVTVHGYLSDNSQNPDAPYKNGTDIEWATEGGAEVIGGMTSSPTPTGTAPLSVGTAGDDDWGPPQTPGASALNSAPQPSPGIASPGNKDDYWAKRDEQDEARTREIESAWSLRTILEITPDPSALTDKQIVKQALDLIVMKRAIAEELKGWA